MQLLIFGNLYSKCERFFLTLPCVGTCILSLSFAHECMFCVMHGCISKNVYKFHSTNMSKGICQILFLFFVSYYICVDNNDNLSHLNSFKIYYVLSLFYFQKLQKHKLINILKIVVHTDSMSLIHIAMDGWV